MVGKKLFIILIDYLDKVYKIRLCKNKSMIEIVKFINTCLFN
jgi:hypothetical protein